MKKLSPLAVRMSLTIALIIALMGGMATVFLASHLARDLEAQFQERGKTLGLLLARLVNEGIAEENLDLLNRASYFLAEPEVKWLCVYNEFWDPIDSYSTTAERPMPPAVEARDFFREHPEADTYFNGDVRSGGPCYDFYARVRYQPFLDSPPVDAGFVLLHLGTDRIIEARQRIFRLHLGVAVLFCAITIMLLVRLLHGLVVRPVLRLRQDMELFGRGVMPPPRPQSTDEIGDLDRQFAAMTATIEERSQALRLAASVMESTLEGIFITDSELLIIEINPAFTDITGMSLAEVRGKSPLILGAGHHDEERYREIQETVRTSGFWQGEVWNRRKDGEVYAAWLNVTALQNSQGRDTGYVCIFTDITQRKLMEEHLKKLAHYDVLTGLPNRALFLDRLDQTLLQAKRQQGRVAVLFLDLDKFKPINDSMGHDAGDEILREVAERLRSCVRECDTVARLGGDEFTIILNQIKKEANAVRVAEKLLATMSRPFHPKKTECRLGVSIGISIYPDHGLDHETLMQQADSAMYLAKEEGGSTHRLYKPQANAGAI